MKSIAIAKYRLKREMPGLPAGAIFEHRDFDEKHPDRGNRGCGVMILAWISGNCQAGWSGETFILPGQLAEDENWFEPVQLSHKALIQKLSKIKKMIERIENEHNLEVS